MKVWFNSAMKICLATENKGKVAEIQAILDGLPINTCTSTELGIEMNVAETGNSYRENAYLKASAYAVRTNLPSLGDDSGLEVAVLQGAPGLFSNRFAPIPNATDHDRRVYLLSLLTSKQQPWIAFFTCTICFCLPNGRHWFFTGRCDGEIIPIERGTNGFGYDPIFQLSGSNQTMAELSDIEKNKVSHRARALQNILPLLKRLTSKNILQE
jgi:XTP/dITP diphosphohydrolase